MAAYVSPSYGTLATIVLTALSLGSDTALMSGRQSTVINNSTICGTDIQIQGYFTLGTGLATIAKTVEIWFFAGNDGTNYSAGLTSIDAAISVCGQKTNMRLADVIPISSTTAATLATKKITVGPYSVNQVMKTDVPPIYTGMFLVQNTCGALFSTSGAHEFTYQPLLYASN